MSRRLKYKIQVRKKVAGKLYFEAWGYIWRVPWSEPIGNFNPMFCQFQNKRTLVQSEHGDLSDPFRRDESYAETLYVELGENDEVERQDRKSPGSRLVF